MNKKNKKLCKKIVIKVLKQLFNELRKWEENSVQKKSLFENVGKGKRTFNFFLNCVQRPSWFINRA